VEAAIRRAGRLGDAWLGGPSARLDELARCVRLHREARTAAGREPEGGDLALMRYVFVASTAEQARATAGLPFIRCFEDTYFRWPHPVVKRPAGALTIERLAEDRIILGDPPACIAQIRRLQRTLGLTQLICRISAPGIPRDAARASLDLFTREVLPALA
jgi:alkanesulfonate monooxygenase SsuD/methylene tetrahydromethanopterin reductase-like flavin-dependent oxidoreductase (luciferase family)